MDTSTGVLSNSIEQSKPTVANRATAAVAVAAVAAIGAKEIIYKSREFIGVLVQEPMPRIWKQMQSCIREAKHLPYQDAVVSR